MTSRRKRGSGKAELFLGRQDPVPSKSFDFYSGQVEAIHFGAVPNFDIFYKVFLLA